VFSLAPSAKTGVAAFDSFGAYWLFVIAFCGGILSWLILRLTERSHRIVERING